MALIKICGLFRAEDAEAVNDASPDYAGFVFARESRRAVGAELAALIKSLLKPDIKTVGVFVNEKTDFICSLTGEGIIDAVQLHGDETPDYVEKLKNLTDKPVIKAVRVRDAKDVRSASSFGADCVLFDSYSPGSYGGTGKIFDWNILKDFWEPFFLAGGINSANASAAIEACSPYCLDASGGVETNGVKDKRKIKELVDIVRSVK